MPVKIRLARIGKKHVPFYRLVAVDAREKRDGEYLANLGTYDAIKGGIVQFDEAEYHNWISKGAIPTDAAKKIFKKYKKLQSTETSATDKSEKTQK